MVKNNVFLKLISYMLFIFVLLLSFGAFSVLASDGLTIGTGTSSDPYIITTASQLDNIRNKPTAYFVLNNDLNLNSACSLSGAFYNGGSGWVPIKDFAGNFNGNGKTISGLKINRPDYKDGSGLFQNLKNGAIIKNLSIVDFSILGNTFVGGIAGSAITSNGGKILIQNVKASGIILKDSSNTFSGGIVGILETTSSGDRITIENSSFSDSASASVSATFAAGGIVGKTNTNNKSAEILISHCYTSVNLNSNSTGKKGGIIGIADKETTLNYCYYDIDCGVTKGVGGTLSNYDSFYDSHSTVEGKIRVDLKKRKTFVSWSDFDSYWMIYDGKSMPNQLVFFEGFTVTFSVRTGDGKPISSAEIMINNKRLLTNSQGTAIIKLNSGNYPYIVEKVGIAKIESNFTVLNADYEVVATAIKNVSSSLSSSSSSSSESSSISQKSTSITSISSSSSEINTNTIPKKSNLATILYIVFGIIIATGVGIFVSLILMGKINFGSKKQQ